jgi:hypothetical protein
MATNKVPHSVADALVVGHVALAACVGVSLVGVATATGTPVAYVVAALVAAALVLGPSAGVGGAVGVVLHDLFTGAVGTWTVGLAVWLVAFAVPVAWLGPRRPPATPGPLRSRLGRQLRALAAFGVGGVYATALSAWLLALVGGQRFYVAAYQFLPGVPVAAALGAVALVVLSTRSGRRIAAVWTDRRYAVTRPETDGGVDHRHDRPGWTFILWLLAVGVAWLAVAGGLDLFAHDLTLFANEAELLVYARGLFGEGSPIATVVVSVYRYGTLAVHLSAPLVVALLLAVAGIERFGVPAPWVDATRGGHTDD